MNDAFFMRRALDLAEPRIGLTGENPAVGCVIVKNKRIVGAGATGEGGRPYAEEVALGQAGENARGGIAYVTLEPCAQRSAGGVACADRLIAAGVARVVVATPDPHHNAAGAGLDRIRAANIKLDEGVLEADARKQNAAFFAKLS